MRPLRFLLVLMAASAAVVALVQRREDRTPVAPLTKRPGADHETLYQESTLGALMAGQYQTATTVGELKRQGDIGLGTFRALDGEMVVLDGVVYQVKADGTVVCPDDDTGSSYATVTKFEVDGSFELTRPMDLGELQRELDDAREDPNEIHVFRIDGHFDHVRTRSVPAQVEPYRPLPEVLAEEPEFEFRDVDGTIVAIWFPPSFGQLDPPGYHMHFLTAARNGGGHLLDARPARLRILVDATPEFQLSMPLTAGAPPRVAPA